MGTGRLSRYLERMLDVENVQAFHPEGEALIMVTSDQSYLPTG